MGTRGAIQLEGERREERQFSNYNRSEPRCRGGDLKRPVSIARIRVRALFENENFPLAHEWAALS
jgi:hypothetical protein